MALTFSGYRLLVERERLNVRRQAHVEAAHVAGEIRLGLSERFQQLEKLGTWWLSQGKPLERAEWETDGSLFLSGNAGLERAMWLDRGGVQRWSIRPGHPPDTGASETAPAWNETVRLALSRQEPVLSRIVDLPDGLPALYACVPVRVNGHVRGYVAGLYNLRGLLDSVFADHLPQVSGVVVMSGGRKVYDGAAEEPVDCPDCKRDFEVHIANVVWQAGIMLPGREIAGVRTLVNTTGSLLTLLLYLTAVAGQAFRARSVQLERANAALQAEIQERERTEAEIARLNRDLRRQLCDFGTLIDVIPIGIAVAEDRECRQVWFNRALAEMIGVEPSAAGAALPGLASMRAAAGSARTLLGEELKATRPDGQNLHLLSYSAPLLDECGRVRRVLNACVDITERERSEEERRQLLERERAARRDAERSLTAFQQSEARLRRLIESDVIGIVIVDDTHVLEANAFFLDLIGYTRSELLDGSVGSLNMLSQNGGDESRREELLATGRLRAFEKELVRKDGRRVPALIGGALLESGPERKYICFVLDLTSRRDLEQRLNRAEKLKSLGMMAAGVSHDFNNLLTSILGNAALALDRLEPDDPLRPFLSSVLAESQRAADLVAQILAYTGGTFHSLERVDLSGLLSEMRPSLEHAAWAADLTLDLAADLPPIRADAAEIRRVVANLVTNSVEALGEHSGRIRLRTHAISLTSAVIADRFPDQDLRPGPYVCLEVQDTGCGMPPDVLARIYDPFFTTKFTGRGLGLSVVHGVVRAHRAGIRVESSVHDGARFELVFPAEFVEEKRAPAADRTIAAHPQADFISCPPNLPTM